MNDFSFLANLGSTIKKFRIEKSMTQQMLASLCDFEKASMSRIESGKINVSVLTLKKISISLKIPIKEFF